MFKTNRSKDVFGRFCGGNPKFWVKNCDFRELFLKNSKIFKYNKAKNVYSYPTHNTQIDLYYYFGYNNKILPNLLDWKQRFFSQRCILRQSSIQENFNFYFFYNCFQSI